MVNLKVLNARTPFATNLKILKHLTELNKIHNFQSSLLRNALQTFKNIRSSNRGYFKKTVAFLSRRCLKAQVMATLNRKFQNLVFKPANHKSVHLVDALQRLAKDLFGKLYNPFLKNLSNVELLSYLKMSIN